MVTMYRPWGACRSDISSEPRGSNDPTKLDALQRPDLRYRKPPLWLCTKTRICLLPGLECRTDGNTHNDSKE